MKIEIIPGACAQRRLLVSGTQTTVAMALRLKHRACESDYAPAVFALRCAVPHYVLEECLRRGREFPARIVRRATAGGGLTHQVIFE